MWVRAGLQTDVLGPTVLLSSVCAYIRTHSHQNAPFPLMLASGPHLEMSPLAHPKKKNKSQEPT